MSDSESEYDEEAYSHAIKTLQSKDPEFYQFLKENDEKLLEYGHSDEDEISDAGRDEPSDGEDEDITTRKHGRLSLSEIEKLKQAVQKTPDVQLCKQLVNLMKLAVSQASSTEGQGLSGVDGDTFNEAIKLCLVELTPALYKVLKLSRGADPLTLDPSKSKYWKKLMTTVKAYLADFLKLTNFISEPSSLKQILKHVVNLIPFFAQFMKLMKLLLKKMIHLWSTSEESVRVIALLVIVRGMKRMDEEFHGQILKQMYFAYVRNSKFASVTTLALINFMKHSLAEVYAMEPSIAYEHCFIYLRQLCIHLRNAITTKKKESFQTVYNWQYVHCLQFWTQLVGNLYHSNDAIRTLAYPLVQTITGTINLIPTIKYVPLRFHLIEALIQLTNDTGMFIPVAPIISGVLDLTDFNKKSTFTKKPMNFSCALKASKAQVQESGFRDGVISEVCLLLGKYFSVQAHTIGFPELALPTVVHIKQFLKKNKVAKYSQQLKAVLEKLQQNADVISQQRKSVTFKITDFDEIDRWEEKMKQHGLPLRKRFCEIRNPYESSSAPKKMKLSE